MGLFPSVIPLLPVVFMVGSVVALASGTAAGTPKSAGGGKAKAVFCEGPCLRNADGSQYECLTTFRSVEYEVATCYVEKGQWGALGSNFTSLMIHHDMSSGTYSPYLFSDTGLSACQPADRVDVGSSSGQLGLGGCLERVFYHPAGGGPPYYSLTIRPQNWTDGGVGDDDADDHRWWMIFGIVAIALAGGVVAVVVGVAATFAFVLLRRRASYSELYAWD